MRIKRALIALAFPALLGVGCYAGPTAVEAGVAYGDPPAPPAYYYTPAPRDGYVWIDGNWYWNSGAWAWRPGYWVVDRPGFVYVQGYWGGGHRWYPGHWRSGGTVVRDHRGTVVVPSRPAARATVVPSTVRAAPPARVVPSRAAPSRTVVRDHR